ncbi:MAG: hypothetical protein GYA59_01395 [Chloroflexi bacterium]|nr:hypothetical protein [Chloroflexota bacterium]
MSADYISLATLAQRMDIYERMPIPLQDGLRKSVQITLITNLVCIPLLGLQIIPNIAAWLGYSFFALPVIEPVAYTLVSLIWRFSGPLLILNIASLVLVLLVLAISVGMTRPVGEPIHWLAWGAAIPSGISAVSFATLAVLFVLLVVVTLLIWIVIAYIVIMALIGALGSLDS